MYQNIYNSRERDYDLILWVLEENGTIHDEKVHLLVIKNETTLLQSHKFKLDSQTGDKVFEFEINKGVFHVF